jgi:hypothetical protein
MRGFRASTVWACLLAGLALLVVSAAADPGMLPTIRYKQFDPQSYSHGGVTNMLLPVLRCCKLLCNLFSPVRRYVAAPMEDEMLPSLNYATSKQKPSLVFFCVSAGVGVVSNHALQAAESRLANN